MAIAAGVLRKRAEDIVKSIAGAESPLAMAIQEAWQKNHWGEVIKLGDRTWWDNFLKPVNYEEAPKQESGSTEKPKDTEKKPGFSNPNK